MEISHDTLLEFIRQGVKAPSGDNSQPWEFQIKGSRIYVLNVPEKDTSPFNYGQISNYIAIGAAIENIRIAAEAAGFGADIAFFPDAADEKIVAGISFTKSGSSNDLANYIDVRASNRKAYEPKVIEDAKLAELSSTANVPGSRVVFMTKPEERKQVAHAISAGEKVALEDKQIHKFLFDHVTWSEQEENERHGFYIKTFEFKPPQAAVFRLFSNWKTLSFFNKFHVADFIAKDQEGVYNSSAAFGAIVMNHPTRESFVQTGMILERLWLTATKLGLSIQATTSVHLLEWQLRQNSSTLSPQHQALISERYSLLEKIFKINPDEFITFAFRIGYATPPSGRTTRHEPIVTISE